MELSMNIRLLEAMSVFCRGRDRDDRPVLQCVQIRAGRGRVQLTATDTHVMGRLVLSAESDKQWVGGSACDAEEISEVLLPVGAWTRSDWSMVRRLVNREKGLAKLIIEMGTASVLSLANKSGEVLRLHGIDPSTTHFPNCNAMLRKRSGQTVVAQCEMHCDTNLVAKFGVFANRMKLGSTAVITFGNETTESLVVLLKHLPGFMGLLMPLHRDSDAVTPSLADWITNLDGWEIGTPKEEV